MKIMIRKKKRKERTRKSVGLMIFIFTKQSIVFRVHFHFTDDPNRIELDN